MSHLPQISALSLALLLQSCGEAHFFGFTPRLRGSDRSAPSPKEPVTEPSPPTPPTTSESTGEKSLVLMFVVELPAWHEPDQAPEQGQTAAEPTRVPEPERCLTASSAHEVLDRLPELANDAGDIRIGLVPYAGRVLTDDMITPVPLDEFAARASSGTFCVTRTQS